MLTTLLASVALGFGLVQETDTVVAVRADARLDVHMFSGEVVVRTWNRAALRVRADLGRDERIEIDQTASLVRVRGRSRRGMIRSVDLELTIPARMGVEITGTNLDADVRGITGEIKVETTNGDVYVRGGSRFVTLHSINGDVRAEGVSGRIDLGTTNGEIDVTDGRGEFVLETVSGDITLERVESAAVRATAVSGDLFYDGTLRADGRYWFNTHSGDITLYVPEGTNATVSVSTFSGELESDFPVTLTDSRVGGKRFSFVLGDGSARIELDSFSGTIELRRPGGRRRR